MRLSDYGGKMHLLRNGAVFGLLLGALACYAAGMPRSATGEEVTPPSLDVRYVATPHALVQRMLEMAAVGEDDYVVDLGSGDGRIVIAAVRDFNARAAYGIDLDPERIAEARENARLAGVEDRVVFEEGDLFEKDFSDATVLTLYLLQPLNNRLRPVILERMAPGTRIVSHAFDMGDWRPDHYDIIDGHVAYLWTVPAPVAGEWRLVPAGEGEIYLSLNQDFQWIDGAAVVDGTRIILADATLHGDRIAFSIGADRYVGTVAGDAIVSLAEPGAASNWHADRR